MDRFPALAAPPPSGLDVRPSIIESSASHLKWMKGLFDIASLSSSSPTPPHTHTHSHSPSRRTERLRLASLGFTKVGQAEREEKKSNSHHYSWRDNMRG